MSTDTNTILLAASVFVLVCSLFLFVTQLLAGRHDRLETRLAELSAKQDDSAAKGPVQRFARTTLPRIARPLLPTTDENRTRLRGRLLHAGYYGRQDMVIFLGMKMILIISPLLLCLAAVATRLMTVRHGILAACVLSLIGMLAPGFWLDYCKRQRQRSFRRALPDALDIVVICLEGGLSLTAAFERIAQELGDAHPLLAGEMAIIDREMQLGAPTGLALRHFADRADLEEIRSLASVIMQSERVGASLVKALRVHADALRTRRLQRAEELAQQASVKILFPTLFFIFPGVFIVVLVPAAIRIIEIFAH